MRNRTLNYILPLAFAAAMLVTLAGHSEAQSLAQEAEERRLHDLEAEDTPAEIVEREKRMPPGRWFKHLRLSYGYDTNPMLRAIRKGDMFETFRFGLDYRKTLAERHQVELAFNTTHQNFHEITDLTNTLGALQLNYKWAFSKHFILGLGHDISLAYYSQNAASEFMYNKSFINLQHRVNDHFYHKLQFEYGWKSYDEALAYLNSTKNYKDDNRWEERQGLSYSIGYSLTEKLSANLTLRCQLNDANSDFQDYHDYSSFDIVPRVYYQFNDKVSANASYSYKYKRYEDRLVSQQGYEQLDKISRADIGLNYRVNASNSATLSYTYQENDSNNSLSDYSGSTIEAGWLYNF